MTLELSNRDARRLWLNSQGLAQTPTGPVDVLGTIKQLGFVQLDTIRVIARAHHHILWSRNQNYRESMLGKLLAQDRTVFEHFTHDASILPMETYPMWRRQFRRMEVQARTWEWHRGMVGAAGRDAIKARITEEGPLSTHAFDTKVQGKKEMWRRPPHKLALDYLWYAGELSTSHRENFKKYYDLTDRVIPEIFRETYHAENDQVDWLCRTALQKLAFGTEGDIQRFWAATELAEVKNWVAQSTHELVDIKIELADRTWMSFLAPADIEYQLSESQPPTSRLRILNPFDPAVRDRTRLLRLFGFDYKIEIFVPAAKRRWGYYVYPLLEGDRFVGRIEARADRKAGTLIVNQLWAEAGVKWTASRADKLDAEINRLARFVGVEDVIWTCGSKPV